MGFIFPFGSLFILGWRRVAGLGWNGNDESDFAVSVMYICFNFLTDIPIILRIFSGLIFIGRKSVPNLC